MLTTIADNISGNIIEIKDKSEIKHIIQVFRMKIGDKIRCIDYKFEYYCEIIDISKSLIILKILEKKEDIYSFDFNLDIAIGILKNDKMKLLIQKLTEIGVNSIIPLNTERVVVKIDEKKEKWELIVKETLKQCKGIIPTRLEVINEIKNINYEKYDLILLAYENSQSSKSIKKLINNEYKNILCIVGPEGGFTETEVEFLLKKGAKEVSLGNRILRAETAAIYLSSIVSNLMQGD